MTTEYSELSPYDKMRTMVIDGLVSHEHMEKSAYELLLTKESEQDKRNMTVIEFCTVGLKRFDEYTDCEDTQILWGALRKTSDVTATASKPTIRYHTKSRRGKRLAVVLIAIIGTLLVATATAAALGYNLVDIVGTRLSELFSETPTDYNGRDITWNTDNTRYYNSMNEMLESENLNILYPTQLPEGYEFTGFEVTNFSTHLSVRAYSTEPFISFEIEVGTSQSYNGDYLHEINGIKYNVDEAPNGRSQAWWFYGNDYYWIVGEESILSEIINNLKFKED